MPVTPVDCFVASVLHEAPGEGGIAGKVGIFVTGIQKTPIGVTLGSMSEPFAHLLMTRGEAKRLSAALVAALGLT